MKNYQKLKQQLLKNNKVKHAYDKLAPEYSLIESLIEKRIEKGLTQQALALKINTKQSAISRLESGNYNPSLAFLHKVARGLGARLKFSFI
ncbi:helix-turn-helix domain-containing protein [Patescibacteria group bacterium]|nr:helix-turn-helix domain-containing protein [Patescibacteria group bacterium]MBU1885140.1 helix-turn-helix domain-containing protein [Patescibacteria group bacterium]